MIEGYEGVDHPVSQSITLTVANLLYLFLAFKKIKLNFIYFNLFIYIFILFWCVDVKNNF
jgi:hypothetical protein